MTDALELIEKLSGENYSVWEVCMKAILVNKIFWGVANPENDDSSTDSMKSEKELALIFLALDEDQIVHIEKCTTPCHV